MRQPPSQPRSFLRWLLALPLSLRAKLVVGNMLIVLIATLGMGYYVYYRAQEGNNYLTTQLEQSLRQKAEEEMATTAEEQAGQLNSFFASKSKDITLIGATVERLLAQEPLLNSGTYWNASQNLTRLPNGSWDNQNTESSSIFMPANIAITSSLVSELNTIKLSEVTIPFILKANPEIVAIYFGGTSRETIYYPNIDLANIVPPDFDVTGRPWFVEAAPAANPNRTVIWSEPYQDAALHGLVVTSSIPVYDAQGNFRGVTAMDFQLNKITEIVSSIHVGNTGYAFLVDKNNHLIAFPQAGYNDFGVTPEILPLGDTVSSEKVTNAPVEFFEILSKISAGESGLTTLTLGDVERLIVYRPIPEVGYGLAIIAPVQELQTEAITARQQIERQTANTIVLSLLVILAILVVATVAAYGMGNALTVPLKSLTGTAEEITNGNLEARAEVLNQDEIGILGQTLNTMANTLSGLFQSLEQRVAERTADLEISRQQTEKRAGELKTISEISKLITGEQRIETLLPLVTRLVSERFDFYHVGIFLIDETQEWAVLQAANSEGGQIMLSRGHKLEVGAKSIVGYVTKYGLPRIALDVGTDSVYFNNPDLPATRSEMSIPLNIHGRTIGALDVQSTKPGAFSENDAKTLSILADQIAITIENARLFGQTRTALAEIQNLYKQDIAKDWTRFTRDEGVVGYHKSMTDSKFLTEALDTDEIRQTINRANVTVFNADGKNSEPTLALPIKLRGQVIGVVSVKSSTKQHQWTSDEIGLAEAISERLGLALDNARLVQESQKRAAKEQAISEITTKISGSINMRNVLQTAVEELGRALPGSEVIIEFEQKNGKAE